MEVTFGVNGFVCYIIFIFTSISNSLLLVFYAFVMIKSTVKWTTLLTNNLDSTNFL